MILRLHLEAVDLVHILFTPGHLSLPACGFRLEIAFPTSQEKIGTLFCLFRAKNLDAKSSLGIVPGFPSVRVVRLTAITR
mgnify:CR=1 FL=1